MSQLLARFSSTVTLEEMVRIFSSGFINLGFPVLEQENWDRGIKHSKDVILRYLCVEVST